MRGELEAYARGLGIARLGIARADVPLDVDYRRYQDFLERGLHGDLGYLERNGPVRQRLDHEGILPGARSVICVAVAYARPKEDSSRDGDVAARIAAYARGRDYHNFVPKRLRKLAAFVEARAPGTHTRVLCDTAPVLERAWAARSGLGFVGKNGLVIVPGLGSFVLLGEVVCTVALPPDEPMSSRCGSCTRCLTACPTGAFAEPYVLDAKRCLSYWGIEHKGAIPPWVRSEWGSHLFGCDDCQTVCPWNVSDKAVDEASWRDFVPDARWGDMTLERFLSLGDEELREIMRGSPLARPGVHGMRRNALLVVGSERRATCRALVENLLRARTEPDSTREAAAWALGRIDGQPEIE